MGSCETIRDRRIADMSLSVLSYERQRPICHRDRNRDGSGQDGNGKDSRHPYVTIKSKETDSTNATTCSLQRQKRCLALVAVHRTQFRRRRVSNFKKILHCSIFLLLNVLCLTCHGKDHQDESSKASSERPPPPERMSDNGGVNHRLDTSRIAPFDKDIRDDCRSLLVHCQSDMFAHVFLQCPATCTQYLHEEGMKGTAAANPDALYDVGTLRTYQGRRIEADRFEGYVLVVAIVPLLPGMAVYYYEMMEHLHAVFAPHVEFVIIPLDLEHGIHIQQRKDGGKVVVLEEESVVTALESHPWVRHLSSIKPRSGLGTKEGGTGDEILQRPIQTDRVTFYIVSADGYYVECLISPSMDLLQRKIALYQKTIDYDL